MKNHAPAPSLPADTNAQSVSSRSPQSAGSVASAAGWILALVIILPVAALIWESIAAFFTPETDSTFSDIASTVLTDYITNSILVVTGSVIFALFFAVPSAWWCAHYEFRGRRWLQWAMVFPLAVPAYISAYIYTDAFDYAGPVQTQLRSWFGWQSPNDYVFFDLRSRWGASLMLALALYPYIYLVLRNAFGRRAVSLTQAARTLGASPQKVFFTIHLPMVRPALAIGCTLVAMEALADYGTVHLFAVSTLTTAIYDSWLVYGSLSTAARIATLTLFFVVLFVWLEKNSRKKQQHFENRSSGQMAREIPSAGTLSVIWGYCGLVLFAGFIIPAATLIYYCLGYWDVNWNADLWQHSQSTLLLAFTAALIATLVSLFLNSQARLFPGKRSQSRLAIASLGYAIPGTVLAIGILIPLGQADILINRLLTGNGFSRIGLILSGSVFALIMAYVIRFAAISNGSIRSAYEQMPQNLDNASTMLRAGKTRTFFSIHMPVLLPSVATGFLLVFIECVKELPASLLLRPFNFETLATWVYQFASDEQLEHAAAGALFIITVSLLPILILSKTQKME